MRDTLGNIDWLRANEEKIKDLLPQTWTHIENLSGLKLGYGLKLLGVDWRNEQQFGAVMVFLEKTGLMLRQNGFQVRANPNSVFGRKDLSANILHLN